MFLSIEVYFRNTLVLQIVTIPNWEDEEVLATDVTVYPVAANRIHSG